MDILLRGAAERERPSTHRLWLRRAWAAIRPAWGVRLSLVFPVGVGGEGDGVRMEGERDCEGWGEGWGEC